MIFVALTGACAKTTGATARDGAAGGGGSDGNGGGAAGSQTAPTDGGGGVPDSGRDGSGGAGGLSPCDAARANNSAQGCEFYSVPPATFSDSRGDCFAALLSNTWTSPVTIQVSFGGTPLDVAGLARTPRGSGATLSYEPLAGGQLAPGQVAVLFLASYEEVYHCPLGVKPGVTTIQTSIEGTGIGKAFHISTSAPVAAFDIFPYGGAESVISSATLLIPTSAWGTNYMAVDAYEADPSLGEDGAPFIQIVAAEDETKVTINPRVAIEGGGFIAAAPASRPQTYTLSQGQVLQFLQSAELAGSGILSDKPVGVWGGSSLINVPVGFITADTAHQQILPVNWLGSEYVAVRYRDRRPSHVETVPWTFIGAVDGTALTYDPAPPPGAPTSLRRGEIVRFSASDPFVVRSGDNRHPFYVAGHMTARNYPGRDDVESAEGGDPEFVNTVPPQQWLPSYLFLTDPTYKNTHLVFIRQKGTDMTFKDVTLDCMGLVKGWAPVGAARQFEFARVDFNKQPGGCMDGAHTAHSAAPFGLTVWGWDAAVSYAYPAGLSTKAINPVVVPVVE